MILEGIFPPLTSCFYPDGRPYWRKLEQNVERYSRTPVSGLVLLGSTGEAVMLSDEESRQTLLLARQAAAPEKVLIAGVGRESVVETLRLAEYAAQVGYDVVLVRTPHFYRGQMRKREMLAYYESVADRSPLPVLLYSVPGCTAYELPVEFAAELAHHPNILGIKASNSDAERIACLVESTRGVRKRTVTVTPVFAAVTGRMVAAHQGRANTGLHDSGAFIAVADLSSGGSNESRPRLDSRTKEVGFQVLCGSPQSLQASLEAGASGGILAMADFVPQAIHEIYTAWKEGDSALAAGKQQRILQAADEVCGRFGIPGIKHALDFNGYFGGKARLPLLPLTAEEQRRVEELLHDLRN